MSDRYQSLSHARWNGTYHVVFVPKRRRKTLYGTMRKAVGPIVHELAHQKACRIIEGHVMADQVHSVSRSYPSMRWPP
jgi:putative transposase